MSGKPAAGGAKPAAKSSPLRTAYVLAYNAYSMAGWAYVLFLIAVHYKNGGTPDTLWQTIEMPLKIVQTTALMEVLHAITGIVRSSAVTTAIQVASRLIVLWAIVDISAPSQASVLFTVMAVSWALVEPPRYLFYICQELKLDPPYLLTWLRYSLFIVLYPTGITGEVGSLVNALAPVKAADTWGVHMPNAHNFAYSHYVMLLILATLYVPGSPYMIGHMWAQRQDKLGLSKKAKTA